MSKGMSDYFISDGTNYDDLEDGVWYRDGAIVFILDGDANKYYLQVRMENNKKGDPEGVAEFVKNALNGVRSW